MNVVFRILLVAILFVSCTKDEYKKPNGNWNISKIAKDLKMSRTTVYKFIDEEKKCIK